MANKSSRHIYQIYCTCKGDLKPCTMRLPTGLQLQDLMVECYVNEMHDQLDNVHDIMHSR